MVAFPDNPSRPGFRVYIKTVERENDCGFPDDAFKLEVHTLAWGWNPGEKLAQLDFCSSYQFFALVLADLTGDGIEEFILVTGKGRGTSAREETLTVYRRNQERFEELLSVEVSGFFGVDTWNYKRVFVDVNGDGETDLRLIREHDPVRPESVDDPSQIPVFAVKEYVYDRKSGKMVLYREVKQPVTQ